LTSSLLEGRDSSHDARTLAEVRGSLARYPGRLPALSRRAPPTFDERLRLIERVLGVSLADPESRASLHVALLAHQEGRS
jgi:hypothetical protein